MKAMLRSDFLNFMQSARTLALMVIFFLVITLVTQNLMFLGTILVTCSVVMPFNLFTYEATAGWDKLSLSLPISRSDIVVSKYLLCAAMVTSLMVVCGAGIVLYGFQNGHSQTAEHLMTIVLCALAALSLLALLLPLIVKFGVIKGRYLLMAIVWAPVMLILFLKDHLPSLDGMNRFVENIGQVQVSLILLALTLLLYTLSALVSITIYRRKEF